VAIPVPTAVSLLAGCLLWRPRQDDTQSCASLRRFIRSELLTHNSDCGGRFPCGGKDEWDSLAERVECQAVIHVSGSLGRHAQPLPGGPFRLAAAHTCSTPEREELSKYGQIGEDWRF